MVSIITCYWGEYKKYLDECLDSIKAQTYKDYEVIVIDDETDLAKARNKGIRKAKGDWVVILDVDNKLTPDYLEKTAYKGDIVATDLQYFEDSNAVFKTIKPTLEILQNGNVVDANAGFKKSVWQRVGGYDENMPHRGWEDYDFWYRCLKAGYEIEVISKPLILYRKHGFTMASEAGKNSQELKQYILNKICAI